MTFTVLRLCVLLALTVSLKGLKLGIATSNSPNDAPIIGILTQETHHKLEEIFPGQFESYIAASYVKYIEGGGARVVPIWIGKPVKYYEDIMTKINGVLFPGGSTWFNQSAGYADAGRHIYDIAVKMNNGGKYMPLWGTCLGFQLLTYLAAGSFELRARCSSMSQPLPLEFKEDFAQSKLFKRAPENVVKILSTEPVTPNFHQYCVTETNLTVFNLSKEWQVISLNSDWNGFSFISTIEAKRYPFYGVQFHPEKSSFEWVRDKNIVHSLQAVLAAQYFANFFVEEARKSTNQYPDVASEQAALIYNYPSTYTGRLEGVVFDECYLFQRNASSTLRVDLAGWLLAAWSIVAWLLVALQWAEY